jgi:hypothetical protein
MKPERVQTDEPDPTRAAGSRWVSVNPSLYLTKTYRFGSGRQAGVFVMEGNSAEGNAVPRIRFKVAGREVGIELDYDVELDTDLDICAKKIAADVQLLDATATAIIEAHEGLES